MKNKNLKSLIIGGAQLGLDYGINNSKGQVSKDEICKLIKNAVLNGIECIDTAQDYGNSEENIGSALKLLNESSIKVITKLNIGKHIDQTFSLSAINDVVNKQFNKSLVALGDTSIHALLLHRAEDITNFDGKIWQAFLNLKKNGKINHIGASVQSPEELLQVLTYEHIEYIQMPFNILDNRWSVAIEEVIKIQKLRTLHIHIRSVFLQGLLLTSNVLHHEKANVPININVFDWLNNKAIEIGRDGVADLCIAFIRSLPWVDALVIGMDSEEQLQNNINLFSKNRLSEAEINNITSTRPLLSEESLDPAKWKL